MIQAAMVTDDFSFPTITEPLPGTFPASLSLWRVSSGHGDTGGGGGEESSSILRADTRPRRKSISDIESGTKSSQEDTSEDEEKMDMLWENFNDDLQRVSSFNLKKEGESSSKGGGGAESDSNAAQDMVELCCVQALKMTKTSSATLSPRRPSMLLILKFLKKLFLLHNSHCSKKPIS